MPMLLLAPPLYSAAAFSPASQLSHSRQGFQSLSSTRCLSSHPLGRRIHPRLSLLLRTRRLAQSFSQICSLPFHFLSQQIHLNAFFVPHSSLYSSLSLRVAAPASVPYTSYPTAEEQSEAAKLSQVSKRLEYTSRYFKRLGSFGFWGQLVCTIVSAVIISFSTVIRGKVTSPVTFYATAGGIAAAFVSVFWSFGYIRLSERLQKTANDPAKKFALRHFDSQLEGVFQNLQKSVHSEPLKCSQPRQPQVITFISIKQSSLAIVPVGDEVHGSPQAQSICQLAGELLPLRHRNCSSYWPWLLPFAGAKLWPLVASS